MPSGLRDRWDESVISSLYEWGWYDTEALRTRGGHPQKPAKPRIELMFWINSRNNSILEWQRAESFWDALIRFAIGNNGIGLNRPSAHEPAMNLCTLRTSAMPYT
jgi:hypothetical protein